MVGGTGAIRRRATAALVCLAVLSSIGVTPARAAEFVCPPPDQALQGSPRAPQASATLPVRSDTDGFQTITLAVDDPIDGGTYRYGTQVPVAVPLPQVPPPPPPSEQQAGIFSHRWTGMDRSMVTYGIFTKDPAKIRIPLFIVENGPSEDLVIAALTKALDEVMPFAANGAPFALNTIAPTPTGFYVLLLLAGALSGQGALISAGNSWMMHFDGFPSNTGYDDLTPVFVWTAYRSASGQELWAGNVLTHTGRYRTQGAVTEGCRRTRINLVTRTSSGTTSHGGVWITEHSRGQRGPEGFTAQQDIVSGINAAGTDVPIGHVRQTESKKTPYQYGFYASEQRDEIMIGVDAAGTFIPLVGTRADTTHGAPPDAQRRLISVGAYDPLGGYHPVVGVRTHFDSVPADLWLLIWALGGDAAWEAVGGWQVDVGVFDPLGSFHPVAGANYSTDFPGAVYPYHSMLRIGVWALDTFVPLIGVTYDGERSVGGWALSSALGDHPGMKAWYVSGGVFVPVVGGYAPLVGASFKKGTPTPAEPVAEEYRVGVFPASYSSGGRSNFIPLAGANWHSSMSSGSWAALFALSNGRAPVNARVDIGAVGPDGAFIPVAGARASAGRPDRYAVGAYVLGSFMPVLEVCSSPFLPGGAYAGVAVFAGGTRVPVGWVGVAGNQPAAGPGQDCPA